MYLIFIRSQVKILVCWLDFFFFWFASLSAVYSISIHFSLVFFLVAFRLIHLDTNSLHEKRTNNNYSNQKRIVYKHHAASVLHETYTYHSHSLTAPQFYSNVQHISRCMFMTEIELEYGCDAISVCVCVL